MKNKYILVLLSLFFINCSLDTFKKENLASWSIDVETPMYKSNLTLHKLLKDFEELTIEPFETSGDSIFAFTVSHFDSVVVPNFTITKAGGFIVPIPVPVLGYDVEVPILPEELDGMNLVDIDLSLIFDLTQINITLLDSVIVSLLTLTATNDDGEIVTAQLTNQDVFVNIVGGLRVGEPAVDLAVAIAIASSYQDLPLAADTAFIGGVGLSGELRAVAQLGTRLSEAAKLGFRKVYVPQSPRAQIEFPDGLEVISSRTLLEVLKHALKDSDRDD